MNEEDVRRIVQEEIKIFMQEKLKYLGGCLDISHLIIPLDSGNPLSSPKTNQGESNSPPVEK